MNLDTFTRSYIEAALWSSTDNANESGGEPLDQNYSISDIAPETLAQMVSDCKDFQSSFGEYWTEKHNGEIRAGHDFWLTRNGHGAGFWDGDWKELMPAEEDSLVNQYHTVGDYLTAMCKPYGSFDMYVGDDGKIYGN